MNDERHQGNRGTLPKILAIYGLCADLLNAIGHVEDPQQHMSDAEVITTGLVAM